MANEKMHTLVVGGVAYDVHDDEAARATDVAALGEVIAGLEAKTGLTYTNGAKLTLLYDYMGSFAADSITKNADGKVYTSSGKLTGTTGSTSYRMPVSAGDVYRLTGRLSSYYIILFSGDAVHTAYNIAAIGAEITASGQGTYREPNKAFADWQLTIPDGVDSIGVTVATYASYVATLHKEEAAVEYINVAELSECSEQNAANIGALSEDIAVIRNTVDNIGALLGSAPIAMSPGYISNRSGVLDISNPSASTKYLYAKVPCAVGDVFTVSGEVADNLKVWAFCDAAGVISTSSTFNETIVEQTIKAPAETAYLVLHNSVASDAVSYEGELIKLKEIDKAVEGEIFRNHYDSEAITAQTALDVDGIEIADVAYKCTDFIKIPLKYGKVKTFTHAFDENGYVAVYFYDADKLFISSNQDAYAENLETYVYARAVYPAASERCGLYFSNESIKPTYTKPERYLLGTHDRFSYAANVVSDGTMEAMIRTALRYAYDERWGYGTEHTAFATECIKTTKDTHTSSSAYDGERYQMDCSTYVLSILMGLVPECSRYLSDKNVPAEYGYQFNALVDYEGIVYGERQRGNTKRLYANTIAEYANRNGYLFEVEDGFRNIKPGDVLFLSNQGKSYQFFEDIGHCQLVYQVVEASNGSKIVQVFEAVGGTGSPCKLNTLTAKSEDCLFAARFPVPYVRDTGKDIAQTKTLTETINASAGGNATVGTIELKESLKLMRDYTVVLHGQFPDGAVPYISVDGVGNVGLSRSDLLMRADGMTVIRFALFSTHNLTNAQQMTIKCRCNSTVSAGEVNISSIEVFDGFVTPTVHP